jgi:protein phosphatase
VRVLAPRAGERERSCGGSCSIAKGGGASRCFVFTISSHRGALTQNLAQSARPPESWPRESGIWSISRRTSILGSVISINRWGTEDAAIMSSTTKIETADYQFVISPSAMRLDKPKPPSASVRAEVGALSHAGKVRSSNEDHFLVFQVRRAHEVLLTNVPHEQLPDPAGEVGQAIIVADGMGGMAAGEVASRMAITTSLKMINRSEKWGFKINHKEARDLFDRVTGYFQEIDKSLTERSETDSRYYGMGTTMTVAYSVGVDLFIIHVGDSRAYLYRGGELRQLTKDHTIAQAMADAGYIAPEEVRRHKRRNVLTKYLGGHHGKIKADVRWLRLAHSDRLLVCTDGLTEMVPDDVIAGVLNQHEAPAYAAKALVDEALKRGGSDNVTVVVARYEVPAITASDRTENHVHDASSDPTSLHDRSVP